MVESGEWKRDGNPLRAAPFTAEAQVAGLAGFVLIATTLARERPLRPHAVFST